MTNLVGQTLGGYAVLEQLGAGGMGAVFKARQPVLDRVVALKVITPQVAQDPSFIARFQHEAKSAARLNHPNIVQVYAAGEDTGTHFMVSEFVEGESLHQRLSREGRMDPQEALAICVFVAEGLKYAWDEAQIIHRDIKPANIFLSNKGAVKVGDLGLAKSVGSNAGSALTQSGMTMGTPHYCSPEQAQAEKNIDFRADIYSLGCTLYHMLSGKKPYEGETEQSPMSVMVKQIHDPPPAILQVLPTCPMPVVLLLSKMLVKHPSGRHASYDELITDMRRVHDMLGQPQSVTPASPSSAGVVTKKKSPAMIWAATATVAVLLAAGLFMWAPWKDRSAGILPAQPREVVEQRRQDAGGTPPPAAEQKPERREDPKPPVAVQPTVETVPAKPSEKKPEAVAETAKSDVPVTPSATMTTATTPVEEKAATPAPKAEDTFVKDVAALPPEQQVARVVGRLKELNPGFDGKETHKIESGAVTELAFSTVAATDISPLKALKWLKKLVITPPTVNQKGALADLAPLQGLPLTWLWCHNNPIADLTPLRGMPLTVMSCGGTQVRDLAPLAGMKLTVLSFNDTEVSDLSPLQDMPLTVLWCNNTKVTDLSPLQAMPLQELKCDFVPARDATGLRSIKTLAKINDMATGAFWIRVGPIAATAASRQPSAGTATTSGAQRTMTTSTGIELVWIPPGEFTMGSTPEEKAWAVANGCDEKFAKREGEQRKVTTNQGFWLGRTEVTVGQWKKFTDATGYKTDAERGGQADKRENGNWREPGFGFKPKDNHPVSCISWNDAVAFCEWLTENEKKAGRLPVGMIYRLPAEAEWDHACRGDAPTKFWWGDTPEGGARRLNWAGAGGGVVPVDHYGARGRNRFGLADMLGNVREWCLDDMDTTTAHENRWVGDPSAHQLRGGSCASSPATARCAYRAFLAPDVSQSSNGFRLCCGVPEGGGQAVGTSTTIPTATKASPPSSASSTIGAQTSPPWVTSTGMELVWIPPGEFMLGSTPEERAWAVSNGCSQDYVSREGQSKATNRQAFWLGRTEVTVGQWKRFVNATGYVTDAEKTGSSIAPDERIAGANWRDPKFGFIPDDNHPVCCVSWNDAVAFCEWLTENEKKANRLPAGMVCRLPTEAEWEYACRAGKHTKFWWGDTVDGGEKRLNWKGNGDGFEFVSPVDHYGARGRNKFGLADMLGNVREWCLDGYDPAGAHETLYKENTARRMLRGGSFNHPPGVTRCAVREHISPTFSYSTLGFRVCCGVPEGNAQTVATSTTVPTTTRISPPTTPLQGSLAGSGKAIVIEGRDLDAGFEFTNTSAPYELQGTLAVPTKKDSHLLEAQVITVAAGVEIRGGTIDIGRRGQISIEGAAGKPAVFRSVTFAQNLNGHGFKARNAVFDRCKFVKTGGWMSYASSKWELDSCLLYKCAFASLNGVNYGLKFSQSAFVGMNFPELEHRREKGKSFDHMDHLRTTWNKIVRCQFVDCEIPPTLVWCAEESNHLGCRFVVGETFESQHKTTVAAYVADTVGRTPDAATLIAPAARASVAFNYVRQPFSTYLQGNHCPLADLARDIKLMNWLSSRPASPFTVLSGVKTVAGARTGP
ncbi:MAG: SUMF1/EgtB/PvdO family nonheme iron enzyme [Verrucomicrobia bacterium]|nr:SUMF1/EgtB/PvdO family nonheme iron enzyme [Verrucomicrobiota bacterium]